MRAVPWQSMNTSPGAYTEGSREIYLRGRRHLYALAETAPE
jgi:hypothetical protein